MRPSVAIIGAGPAGLTAAVRLQELGARSTVFDAAPQVGGMARSLDLFGQRVDLGPHRFFTRDRRIEDFWRRFAGKVGDIERRTRIVYRGRLFEYPLSIGNVAANLSPGEIATSLASYARERIAAPFRREEAATFEAWVVARFGRRLYEMFFRTYSEKLWGIPCSQLDADFAAQRIKGFSLGQSVLAALGLGRTRHATTVDSFAYPVEGSGVVYQSMALDIEERGGSVKLSSPIVRVVVEAGRAVGVETERGIERFDHVISTMPLTRLVDGIEEAPEAVRMAASELRFRNTVLVFLEVESSALFPDQWLYVHAPEVSCGRITNFRNWVPELTRGRATSILALEYWCFDDDPIWRTADDRLVATGQADLRKIGILRDEVVSGGHVERLPRCYPIYEKGYRERVATVTSWLDTLSSLTAIGRYGAFKYNNQDHSILMGLLAAENIVAGGRHDLWSINTDYGVYQEPEKPPSLGG